MEKKRQKSKIFINSHMQNQKRGQVTIAIIIAVVIVALAVLIYLFFPKITSTLGFTTENPSEFIRDCMEDKIKDSIEIVSSQGGSLNPENYYLYKDEKIEYLCYTNEYYIPCVVQQPLLKQHIENEIKNNIKADSDVCFNSLKESFENKGFSVNLRGGDTSVELLPKITVVNYEKELTLTKDSTDRYEKLKVAIDNNLYELMSIANSIISMETRYGDSETTIYMNYYHNLKVEKMKQTDGTTIYILTDRDTGDKFQFASRSIAWPPGITR